jgi:exodeoxyribonuclease V alpha subunit
VTGGRPKGNTESCYYSKTLYFDELAVARKIAGMGGPVPVDMDRVQRWIVNFCRGQPYRLSGEQAAAVTGIVGREFSVLTGGPGCGKDDDDPCPGQAARSRPPRVMLAAPTGRAAQRMTDVIGRESKTIHRLLEWQHGPVQKKRRDPLDAEFLIVDECSMLDISLTASLLKAVPQGCQVLFIGDADQLPSVGAGNVLRDIIASGKRALFSIDPDFPTGGTVPDHQICAPDQSRGNAIRRIAL